MKSLNELRDELAYEHTANRCAKAGVPPFGPRTESIDSDFKAGFDAGTKAQAEQSSSTELAFDGEAAFKKATYYAEKYGAGYNSFEIIYAFKGGAFWQHLQDSAALSDMKSELGQRSQATIDKAIAASKLPSDKPSIFADVEFVDNGNNSYLKSKGAAQTMALHILEEQLEKLRAENAELKRRISGHIGAVDIFCERNDNLLAENAILREGLNQVVYSLTGKHDSHHLTAYYFAQDALTAADKVRSE